MKLPMIWRTAVLVLLVAGASRAAEHTQDSFETIKKNLAEEKAVMVDVRERREWDRGHLKDARLLPISELNRIRSDKAAQKKLAEKLPADRIIYCQCAKGVRALLAGEVLEKLGYDVRPLAAGFDELSKSGFETVKPEKQ
jgi:rhodanese-related sulfurtransferase